MITPTENLKREVQPPPLRQALCLGFWLLIGLLIVTAYRLPDRETIETLARKVYEQLTALNQRVEKETPKQEQLRLAQIRKAYKEASANLSQQLLAPVVAELGNKRLLIVADGALQYIPFGALPAPRAQAPKAQASLGTGHLSLANQETKDQGQETKDNSPLIAEHEIITLPSASLLAVLRQEIATRKMAPKSVAVLADPVFSIDDARITGGMTKADKKADDRGNAATVQRTSGPLESALQDAGLRDMGLNRLLNTRREAANVMAFVAKGEGKQALDFAASLATATSAELGEYRIIHFATHGILNSAHPELSGLVLSLYNEQGQSQDGFLRLHEIYNLKLPAELVVLSACQTGLGKEMRGEGLIGLTRGFMYAGTPRVVASLWKVDDRATGELMKQFYEAMLGAQRLRPAAALRMAQIGMLKQKRWQDPYYWAGFVLQGEWK